MFNHGPSDRVQIRQIGQLQHPAVCLLCGNPTNRKGYVDLDTFYEYEGQQYLCYTCVMQVAELMGCIVADEAEHVKQMIDKLSAENTRLQEEINDLKPFADAVRTVVGSLVLNRNSDSSDGEDESAVGDTDDESSNDGTSEQSELNESGEGTGRSIPASAKRRDASFSV